MTPDDNRQIQPGQALEAARAGVAVVVDVREPERFDAGHPPKALSVPYSARGLGGRVSALLEAAYEGSSTPHIIVLAENDDMARQALNQLEAGSVTIDGAIAGGMPAWLNAGLPIESLAEIGADQLTPDARPSDLVVLDVREPIEWEMGHVPGALLISLGELAARVGEVPTDRRVSVICESGIRSAMAASILLARGRTDLVHAVGGTAAYRAAGLPLEYAEPTE